MTKTFIKSVAVASILTAAFSTNNRFCLASDIPGTSLLTPSQASNQNGVESTTDTDSEASHSSTTDSATYNRSEASLDSSSVAANQNHNESGGFLRTYDNPRPPGLPSGNPDSASESTNSDYADNSSQRSEIVPDAKSTAGDTNNSVASTDSAKGGFQISDYVKSYFQSNHARAARLSGKSPN